MGAIASGGIVVMNDEVVKVMKVQADDILDAIASERRELARREAAYREDRPPVDVGGRTIILIDDGLATGSTMRAAVMALRRQAPRGSSSPCRSAPRPPAPSSGRSPTSASAPSSPEPFRAVGLWYEDFAQTEDDEVAELLARAGGCHPPGTGAARPLRLTARPSPGGPLMNADGDTNVDEQEVAIAAGGRTVRGTLSRPRGPRRWSSSPTAAAAAGSARATSTSRGSCRTPASPRSCSTCWRRTRPTTARRSSTSRCWPTGSRPRPTGWRAGPRRRTCAWATSAPARAPARAAGGRPVARLGRRRRLARRPARPRRATRCRVSTAPTLLIVGGNDEIVLELNREAYDQLGGDRQLEIVPGATHLFAEPGALEEVARLARDWFLHT